MGHGRKLRRGYVEDETPELEEGQSIGKVTELRDKGIVAVQVPVNGVLQSTLAYLPPKFRGVLFLRRGITLLCRWIYHAGSFVILSPIEGADGAQKVAWTIETLLRPDDIKQLRKDQTWCTHSLLHGSYFVGPRS